MRRRARARPRSGRSAPGWSLPAAVTRRSSPTASPTRARRAFSSCPIRIPRRRRRSRTARAVTSARATLPLRFVGPRGHAQSLRERRLLRQRLERRHRRPERRARPRQLLAREPRRQRLGEQRPAFPAEHPCALRIAQCRRGPGERSGRAGDLRHGDPGPLPGRAGTPLSPHDAGPAQALARAADDAQPVQGGSAEPVVPVTDGGARRRPPG